MTQPIFVATAVLDGVGDVDIQLFDKGDGHIRMLVSAGPVSPALLTQTLFIVPVAKARPLPHPCSLRVERNLCSQGDVVLNDTTDGSLLHAYENLDDCTHHFGPCLFSGNRKLQVPWMTPT